ncbi:MAG: hypothetical protein H8E53_00735 [Planctomycetes bacterium]|nr:hypothetical protein [Planctomycetota bacterium]
MKKIHRLSRNALFGKAVFLFALAAGAASATGGVGGLKLIARAPKADPFRPIALSSKDFIPLAKKFGAINEDAVMARIVGESLALAVGIDSTSPDAEKLDLIRLDFSGAGEFGGKHSFPLKKIATGARKASAASVYTFGPGVVQVLHDGGKIPVFVEGMCEQNNGEVKKLHVSTGVVAEGSCRFGKKVYGVRVIDADGRLGVNNAPAGPDAEEGASGGHGMQEKNPDAVDVATIDTNSETFKRGVVPVTLGQIAHLDGKWYRVSVSAGGSKISAEQVSTETGSVVVSHDNWVATLIGAKYELSLRGGREPVPAPAGRYVIRRYREHVLLSGASRAAVLTVAAEPDSRTSGLSFSVAAGKATRLKIGSPVTVKPTVETMGSGYAFGFSLADESGMKAFVSLPGRPAPPVVKVVDAKGKQVYSGKMEYG